ncbi:NAD-dependent epimerase/dehydratase [Pirellula staleyi DSM 6068]|uniref:NAD-dependent epimerase/dehydratase n=1 Tax=Pirellula staleyi (strain ATCC 27377 / DSM 6068 / ICPB 4128) TaxID=530564 RepID=D2R667_PIRSD|nr:NAD(P)-dependent oxidoreductase [Pirellula staleyi]ADB19152.1 NAD-dependent epimerase/dehydratase [Pirellula staleyi DSM 6068]
MLLPKRVLVFGGEGFIGSAVASLLRAHDCEVYSATKHSADSKLAPSTSTQLCMLSDQSTASLTALFQELRPGAIINLAAKGVTGKTATASLVDTNSLLPLRQLEAAAQAGKIPLVHTGSCFELRSSTQQKLLTETSDLRPRTAYAATKAAASLLLPILASEYETTAVVLRLFGVYGPGEADSRLLPQLIDSLSSHQPMALTSGRQIRDLCYIDDVAQAIVLATSQASALPRGSAPVWQVSTGIGTSIKRVAITTARLLHAPVSLLRFGEIPDRAGEPRRLVGSHQALSQATGWAPSVSLRCGIQRTIEARLARSPLVAKAS